MAVIDMTISILQTMEWCRLNWDLCFEDVIALDDILPKVGESYPVKLDSNEYFARDGIVHILWQPPHSELNGWEDRRPSEILKSYVIKGILKSIGLHSLEFEFTVLSVMSLIDSFAVVSAATKSPLSRVGLPVGGSFIQWRDARGIQKAKVGDYWFLSGRECETSLEAIISYKDNGTCLHYNATLHVPASYDTEVTQYFLNQEEHELFAVLLNQAETIVEPDEPEILPNQVLGALCY